VGEGGRDEHAAEQEDHRVRQMEFRHAEKLPPRGQVRNDGGSR
jgi:hypothetical protein